MTLIEQIQEQMKRLPPEKQGEVLDFVTFLQQKVNSAQSISAKAERSKRIKSALENWPNWAHLQTLQIRSNGKGKRVKTGRYLGAKYDASPHITSRV